MLNSHIILPNSRDFALPANTCHKCEQVKSDTDGVYMGSKFICGACWRRKATQGHRAKGSK